MGALAPFLMALFTGALPQLVKTLMPDLFKLFGKFQDGQITKAELEAEVARLSIDRAADVDISRNAAMSEGFKALMGALPRSPALQAGWLTAVFSQLFVLFWYQWIVPFGDWQGWWGGHFPSPGNTVDWAYGLLGVLFVGSPLVFPKRLK